jgi:hypothetical protein
VGKRTADSPQTQPEDAKEDTIMIVIRTGIVALVAALVIAGVALPALAQTNYPDVSKLDPFSAETNFMSLPGYLRWVTFQQTSNWITYAEADRIVVEQSRTAGR